LNLFLRNIVLQLFSKSRVIHSLPGSLPHFKLIAFLLLPLFCTSQDLEQVLHIRGESDVTGRSVEVDNEGNIYAVGYFENTITFGSDDETISITSEGSNDIFVSKTSPTGEILWVKGIGAESSDLATDIALDQDNNVYITGSYIDTLSFAPLPIPDLPGESTGNILVLKMDTNGDVIWAKGLIGPSASLANSIEVDNDGNILTTGRLKGTNDFDPGAGEFTLTTQSIDDVFISKLDPEGNFVWAGAFLGGQSNIGRDLDVDPDGNVYITGILDGVADFNPGSGVFELDSGSDDAVFIAKLNAAGELDWAKKMAGSAEGLSIKLDSDQNILTSGRFSQIQDFDPGPDQAILTSAGSLDGFISKLNNDGEYLWAHRIGGTFADAINSIDVDEANNVYTTGFFSGDATYDTDSGEETIIGAGNREVLLTKMSPEGDYLWAFGMGGVERDGGSEIAVDANASVYTIGYFEETANFGPESASLTSLGEDDAFITVHTQLVNTRNLKEQIERLTIYPNPASNLTQLSWKAATSNGFIEIMDMQGKRVQRLRANSNPFLLDLNHLEPGIYFVRLNTRDGQAYLGKLLVVGE